MNRPWMPFYIADYLADTTHLRTVEHGAYLLLIMHYWRTGSLPNDDQQLALITRMKLAEWMKVRPTIKLFFNDEWKHGRIEFELTEAARLSQIGRAGGEASGAARRAKRGRNVANNLRTTDQRFANNPPTNREALHSHSQSEEPKREGTSPFDRSNVVALGDPPPARNGRGVA